jgi:hypothetical protein
VGLEPTHDFLVDALNAGVDAVDQGELLLEQELLMRRSCPGKGGLSAWWLPTGFALGCLHQCRGWQRIG